MAELLYRSAVAAWGMRQNGDVVYKSPRFCALCVERCTKPSSFLGCLDTIVEREDIPSLIAAGASLSTERPTSSIPVRLRMPRRPQRVRANLFHLNGDEPLIFGTFFDEAPGARGLADENVKFRDIVVSQSELIVRFKPDGTITFVNGPVCEFLGCDEREIVGKKIYAFVEGESRAELARALELLTPERPCVQITQHLMGRQGAKWFRWNDRAFFDDGDRPAEYQGVGRDVTDEIEQVARFEREVQHKIALVHEVCHRVNNYTQVVTSLLEEAAASVSPTATTLTHARAQIDALGLVHQLLGSSPDPSRASASTYLRLLVDRLGGQHASNVDVSAESSSLLLTCEELSTLGLVAVELLGSALAHRFPQRAGSRVRLAVDERSHGGYALRIEEDGVGLNVPTAALPSSGGPSIVNRLVAHTGGRVEQIQVPSGTCFVVTWPSRDR